MDSAQLSEKAVSGFFERVCMISTDHHTPLTRSRLSSMPSGVNGMHGTRMVDLAAGTGNLTEPLTARDEEFDIWQ